MATMISEFNLLDEPWILVLRADGTTEKVSLVDALARAPEFERLNGELPTQDVAILRLLLAILHVIVARYSPDGREDPIGTKQQAIARWKEIYKSGHLPMTVIKRYLDGFHYRFFLFDQKYPFYQVATLEDATEYQASKLNGELSESNNKVRLFLQRNGEQKNVLAFDEAARWLLHVNGFDDTSAKPKGKGLPSSGAGWLGKLGIVFVQGETLFETLMLNLVLFPSNGEAWGRENPVWERPVKEDERTEIACPDNLSELYTLQSRRLLLERHEERVIGFKLLGGDFFSKENAFVEPMTLWRKDASVKDREVWVPCRHDPARQMWREAEPLLLSAQSVRRPGLVEWISELQFDKAITKNFITFASVIAKYGDKDFFINDIGEDSLTFSMEILERIGKSWIPTILDQVDAAKGLVDQLGYLAKNLSVASGDDPSSFASSDLEKVKGYTLLDLPFRDWLEKVGVQYAEQEEAATAWWVEAQKIIHEEGKRLVGQVGRSAFVGRSLEEKSKGKTKGKSKILYTAPKAFSVFLFKTHSRERLR